MTYNQILDSMYAGGNSKSIDDLTPIDCLPWRVIEFFAGRKGFDDWWGDLKPGIQDEIFDELRAMLNWKEPN